MTCPPCTRDCNQGRSCPNRPKRRLGDLVTGLWRFLKGEN